MPEKESVYVDTTIFSVLVARPSTNAVAAGHQMTTRIWWQNDADRFDLFTSDAVYYEALDGDQEMAKLRIEYISSIKRLPVTAEAYQLGDELIARGFLPAKAKTDALHLAITTVHRIDYLVTWNCKHLANVQGYRRIDRHLREIGYNPPYMCTPSVLSGVKS
jgi:predicted nucleic acid-binding protein